MTRGHDRGVQRRAADDWRWARACVNAALHSRRAPEVEISGKARGRNTPRATGAWRCHASQRPRLAPRSPCLPARSALPLSAWHACISTRMPSVMHTISTFRSRKQRRAARPCGARSSGGDQHCALQRAIAPPHHPDAVVQTSCTSRAPRLDSSHEPRSRDTSGAGGEAQKRVERRAMAGFSNAKTKIGVAAGTAALAYALPPCQAPVLCRGRTRACRRSVGGRARAALADHRTGARAGAWRTLRLS